MNRIKSLQLNNFKFFQEGKPIELNENNLLLYGENGSGKSSIYWALYTLFEASLKTEDDEIRKYFCKTIKLEDNLINIHAKENPVGSDDYNSFVELVTTDVPEKRYKISKTDVAINTDTDAKFTNYASDFINYRMLLGISAFRHSWKIDLFGVFVEDIFKYVQFSKVKITRDGVPREFTNAFEIWQQIEQGHEIVDSVRSVKPRKIRAYKNSVEWKEFDNLVKSFNDSLKKQIDYINIHAPDYFNKLGYQFTFYLELEKEASYTRRETSYEPIPFVLRIQIPEYEKEKNALYKPHSFLNEAKLSAMAISIRLAILSEKRLENCLKFIVLDDLLISLDMRNREKVLELLLSDEFVNNYQLLIFTHDRLFFQMAKYKIKLLEQDDWKYIEMYETIDENECSAPAFKVNKSYSEKALQFYGENELAEAANNLRKAGEEFCKRILSKEETIAENYSNFDFNGMINHCLNFAIVNNLKYSYFEQLDKFRKFLLNAGSHDDFDTPLFKSEINDCLKIFKNYFDRVKIKHLLPIDTKLHLEVTDVKDAALYRFEISLVENLRIYKEPNKPCILLKSKIIYNIFKGNTLFKENINVSVSLQKFYENLYKKSDKAKNSDFWEEVIISETNLPISSIRKF